MDKIRGTLFQTPTESRRWTVRSSVLNITEDHFLTARSINFRCTLGARPLQLVSDHVSKSIFPTDGFSYRPRLLHLYSYTFFSYMTISYTDRFLMGSISYCAVVPTYESYNTLRCEWSTC